MAIVGHNDNADSGTLKQSPAGQKGRNAFVPTHNSESNRVFCQSAAERKCILIKIWNSIRFLLSSKQEGGHLAENASSYLIWKCSKGVRRYYSNCFSLCF